MAGSTLALNGPARVDRDALVAGGSISVLAPVGRSIKAAGNTLMIGSTVGGAVNANVTQLTLGNAAVVQGPISYISNQDAAVAPGASVLGAVQRTPPAIRPANPMGGWRCRNARAAARGHWS